MRSRCFAASRELAPQPDAASSAATRRRDRRLLSVGPTTCSTVDIPAAATPTRASTQAPMSDYAGVVLGQEIEAYPDEGRRERAAFSSRGLLDMGYVYGPRGSAHRHARASRSVAGPISDVERRTCRVVAQDAAPDFDDARRRSRRTGEGRITDVHIRHHAGGAGEPSSRRCPRQ